MGGGAGVGVNLDATWGGGHVTLRTHAHKQGHAHDATHKNIYGRHVKGLL